jgi:hypothetical protein
MLDKPQLFCSETNSSDNSKKDIDEVFIKIRDIYSSHDLNILYHMLLLTTKHPEHYETYMNAINAFMQPKHTCIKKWINDNIVY